MKRALLWSGLSLAASLIALSGTPKPAEAAHVCMDFPLARVGAECGPRSPQKMGPCPVERTDNLNVFSPGQTIEVIIRETINHPSHYRIAFNPDGDDFQDPVRVDDTTNEYDHILLDGIVDSEEAVQTAEITLPDIECENCTLQLIQVMYDKQENGFGGASGGPNDNDDMYYTCADIALRRQQSADAAQPAPEEERERGNPLPGLFAVAAVGLVGMIRRNR